MHLFVYSIYQNGGIKEVEMMLEGKSKIYKHANANGINEFFLWYMKAVYYIFIECPWIGILVFIFFIILVGWPFLVAIVYDLCRRGKSGSKSENT